MGFQLLGFYCSATIPEDTEYPTVDDINPALNLRTLSYGNNYGLLPVMGNARFIPSTVAAYLSPAKQYLLLANSIQSSRLQGHP